MRKLTIAIFGALVILLAAYAAPVSAASGKTYKDLTDEITNARTQTIYDLELNAPFVKNKSGVREDIDAETGRLSLTHNFFSLPSHSGTFGLSVEYTPANAAEYAESINSGGTDNQNAERTSFDKSLYSLGIGWRLNFPFIEKQDDRNQTDTYAHLPDGSVYRCDTSSDSGLENYTLDDLLFTQSPGLFEDSACAYGLFCKNGFKYYFDSDGYICGTADRFGNICRYVWEESNNIKRLQSISDNSDRTILLEYIGDDVNISYCGQKYIVTRNKASAKSDMYIITAISDPLGNVTKFEYDSTDILYNYYPNKFDTETNTYSALTKVIFPSGLVCNYSYSSGKKWLYEDKSGYIEYLRLSERHDEYDGKVKNVRRYSYSSDPSGYPDYKSDELPAEYIYTTIESDTDGNETIYMFNSEHNPVSTIKSCRGKPVLHTDTSYDEKYNLPLNNATKSFDESGGFSTVFSDKTYDSKGNLLTESTYSDIAEKNARTKTYRYDSQYEICVYESHMQNSNTKVEIVRTLSPNGAAVQSESIYRNGELIKSDKYETNTFGDVTRSLIQFRPKSSPDDTSSTAETLYEYGTQYGMLYPTCVTQRNVETQSGICEDICTRYEYDSFGNITKIINSDGSTQRFEYDLLGRKKSQTSENGGKTEYVFDDKENSVLSVTPNGFGLKYAYNPEGMLESVCRTDTGTILTERNYDSLGRLVREADSLGAIKEYSYDFSDRITSFTVTDSDGKMYSKTNLEYNNSADIGNMQVTVCESDGIQQRKKSYFYDFLGNLIRSTAYNGENAYIKTYEYDYSGNMTAETDESGNRTAYEYDIFGSVCASVDALDVKQTFENDYSGNVTAAQNGEGEQSETTYNSLGKAISARTLYDGKKAESQSVYDLRGNAVRTVDANGNVSDFKYDSMGYVTESVSYAGAASGMKTNYTYDLLGNVTSVSIGSISGETAHTYRYEYDLPGNLTKRIDSADKMYYYEYNDSGLLTKSTDANGVVTEYSYDVLGRKTSIQNSIDPEITYSYNVFGELVRIQQGEKYIEYTYDSLGNKTTENNGLTLDEYTYDERGNITQHKSTDIAAGAVVTGYEYNTLNLPVLVRTGMGIQTIEYDKAGRIIRSQNSNTGAEKTTVYDGRGLIKRTQTAIGDRIIFLEKNWYDSVGNKIFTEEDGEEHEYRYDGMNRLIYAKIPGSEIYYEFDGFGNISHEDISTPLFMHTKDYFYDADNRLTMIKDGNVFIDYGYDNAGNVTDINTGSKHTYFRYDGFGRLISADDGTDITAYTYSPDGRRDSKITNGNKTRFVYDGRNVSAEILPDGNVYAYYRADEIIGSKDSFGNELYYTQNTHGDVIKITDMFGMTIKDYKYSPYGKEETFRFDSSTNNPWILQWKAETTKIHNPFRYAGEYFDEETGFIYLRNRYYDTESSRFVSEDPIRDGLNWYAYCGGNPITFVDPNGTDAIIITNMDSVPLAGKKRGHTSAIYQDSNGEWYYTYWGNKAAAVIHIPKTYIKEYRRNGDITANSMASLNDFNKCLERIFAENNLSNITGSYTNATYVFGDFTTSLAAAYDDVNTAYNNWISQNWPANSGKLITLDDGSKIFQGHNSPYNFAKNNCLIRSYNSLSKGTLYNGKNVGEYMINENMDCGIIPNNFVDKFSEIFMNTSFTYLPAYYNLKDYARAYDEKSPWAKRSEKAAYAKSVTGR